MGLANLLTALRLAGAPVLAWAMLDGRALLAGLVFGLAVATDLLDGRIARSRGTASPASGFFDHVTDATFVTVGLAACAAQGALTAWLPLLVALAFAQYAVDSRVLRGRPLRPSRLGRWNGIAYFVALGIPVVRDALGFAWPPDAWVGALAWALVATSVASMLGRARAALAAGPAPGEAGA